MESERLVEVVAGSTARRAVVEYESPTFRPSTRSRSCRRRSHGGEYGLLRGLAAQEMPIVEAVGVVTDRGEGLEATLITRHLDYSLPFRTLFARGSVPDLRRRLLDAGAELLVRLHLGGFFWGDCSLSNTLFRRDAGALAAYLVDAETGEMHPSLSDGQRGHDLMIAEENVAGELADVEAELGREGELAPEEPPPSSSPLRVALERADAEESFDDTTGSRSRPAARLNELASTWTSSSSSPETRLQAEAQPACRRAGPPSAPPHALTGLMAGESGSANAQRPRTLSRRARPQGRPPVPETVAVHRWLSEVFEPAVAAVPPELWGKRDAAEVSTRRSSTAGFFTAGRRGHRPDAGGSGVRRRRAPARTRRTRAVLEHRR